MRKWIVFIFVVLYSNSALSVITTDINGDGKLTGFNNIEVGGVSYDVDFKESSAYNLWFDGTKYDFLFKDEFSLALLASEALGDAYDLFVFFDMKPEFTYGISSIQNGTILTPVSVGYNLSSFGYINSVHNYNDRQSGFSSSLFYPQTVPSFVYANWSYSVPEPSIIGLILFGMFVLVLTRKNVR